MHAYIHIHIYTSTRTVKTEHFKRIHDENGISYNEICACMHTYTHTRTRTQAAPIKQIFKSIKTEHFKRIHDDTGIAYNEMIFFGECTCMHTCIDACIYSICCIQ